MKEQNRLKPCKIKSLLAKRPSGSLKYATTIKNSHGDDVLLGDPRYSRALIALMNQSAINGGAAAHWGGPAAYADAISAIHGIIFADKKFAWYEKFNFVNDAGHAENGVYAIQCNYGFDDIGVSDLLKFRSMESKLTGHAEVHLNPEGVLISNGPLGSGISQAQGLALADKLIGNDRLTICTLTDGASMEGEARESLAAIPGLAKKGKLNPFVLIISDNDAKLSGRISEDSFDMSPTFDALGPLGWKVVREESGNDIQKVYLAIKKAFDDASAEAAVPVCVILKTVKGYGVKSTEERPDGGHGYPLKAYDEKLVAFINEIYDGDTPSELLEIANNLMKKPDLKVEKTSNTVKEKVQAGISRAAIRAVKDGFPVFSLSSDLPGSTGMKSFQQEFPERTLDLGIAESNMISTAAGLSKHGFIPIVDTFAQFGATKGNLPLIMAQMSLAPVIAVFSHAGFQDAADGASHQSTTCISALASIPDTTVIYCSTSEEAETYLYQAIKLFNQNKESGKVPDNIVFLLGRENFPQSFEGNNDYQWGKAQVLKEGKDATIVATGPMVHKTLEAVKLLEAKGISVTVINNLFVNRPDVETIGAALEKTAGKLITVEDHQIVAGMGAILSHALLRDGHQFKLKSIGIDGKFGKSAYLADQLYSIYNMNAEGIRDAVVSII